MKSEKINYIEDIGQVIYRKNPKAKNLAIRISKDGMVKVTVPYWCSYARAASFVAEKHTWIRRKVQQIQESNEEKYTWGPGDEIRTTAGSIRIREGALDTFEWSPDDAQVDLFLPKEFVAESDADQAYLQELLARMGLMIGKRTLPGLLHSYALKYQLPYEKVGVRRAKTRWGSCSVKNNINLNSALVFLEPEIIEYVCLHELVHTVHKNHGPNFWAAVNSYMPEAKEFRKRLRNSPMIA